MHLIDWKQKPEKLQSASTIASEIESLKYVIE